MRVPKLLLVIYFIPCALLVGVRADEVYKKRMELVWRCINKTPLRVGMAPADVQKVVGLPDNPDWESVVISGDDTYRVWVCVEKNRGKLLGWRDVAKSKSRLHGETSYFVFWNEKLMATTVLPNVAGREDNWFYEFSEKLLSANSKSKPVSSVSEKK